MTHVEAQVASWFSDHEDETGLIVCRVKNKFSAASVYVADGYALVFLPFAVPPDDLKRICCTARYRDFQICVVFTDANGLKIIGEIQVC